ncbi:sensor histidine kinase [Sporomusa acidovorans]|uniref:histidine kinase n=1 Tax=Sporomusa acidovorans (strain ATCC 49682 / DSM 3132 / Mol) TaxID=1123286 RepID=A0ABZ3J4M8_SPOA4|nr:PocR ligand-binding domain-containing protein [Sporomusa acidovorans]OZC15473.1 sensor histidine kinase YehU [Sporomusa acidovorans DSM 3132]SDE15642.1 Histidine kinase-, DNA gyrase B-, and HSP90-like ATPase [Sporomusa acidovorans]
MQVHHGLTLADIVNVKVLQEIQDKFSDATGLAAVIVDSAGQPITIPSNFTRFCNYVRSTSKGLARCMGSDDCGGRMAASLSRPSVYRCHAGLMDLGAPISLNQQHLGGFLAGQVILPQDGENIADEVLKGVADLNLNKESVLGMLTEIRVVPEERVRAAADLLYIMTNYIVEIAMANIVQKQLMDELKAKADLEKVLRETELKALQSQVNPHFLFNTLNTIARLALLEEAPRTQEVVYALSDLLRNNLRNIDEMITVDEEVRYIQNYLLIQKMRFGDRIQTTINIPEKLLDQKIPVMTLQPLVENAIIHGLEPKRDGGTIEIAGDIHDGQYELIITDTGIGITKNQIEHIFRNEKRVAGKGQTTGLGIINVHKRIQHYFGPQCGLEISGKQNEGTIVKISLPYEMVKQEARL